MTLTRKTLAPLALLMLAGNAAAAGPDLAARIAQQDGWVAWQVPKTADSGTACCFQMHGKHVLQSGCDLEGNSWGNSDDQRPPQAAGEALDVYMRPCAQAGTASFRLGRSRFSVAPGPASEPRLQNPRRPRPAMPTRVESGRT